MNDCEHNFQEHYLIPFRMVMGSAYAWVPVWAVEHYHGMVMPDKGLKCVFCGEQGYEVPA